ncbi:MAG: prepilin-type N-terminal cleavage/methylation domain-containing protein [Candidatus Omnitrophota bacterium]|nr:prepilin-type N-terminal cleavage/methylation domain-containing protein [Candidatus Omnitrophota bacterium]
MKKASNYFKGFTFIEVMMGLLIFSIIALSLYSIFSAASLAWRRSKDANRIYFEAKWCLDDISQSLKNAAFFDFSLNYPDLKLFKAETDKISFLIATDSGLKRVSYFLEKPDFGKIHKIVIGKRGAMPDKIIDNYKQSAESLFSLKRKEQDFLSSLVATVENRNLTSLVKDSGLKFSYAYKTTDSESLETLVWKDNWESQNQIPKIIKVNLTLLNPKNLKQEKTFTKIIFIPTGTMLQSE